MLKWIRSLFRRPQITVATYKRKEVDCGLNNETHRRLAKELGKA